MPMRAAAAALAAATVLWVTAAPAQPEARRADAARLMNELMSGKVPVGAPFTLTDPQGKRVSLADFRGKLVLLYFGYTSCPDVCPTDLLAIAQTLQSLGKQGDQVQPLFVTLDPARDTPAVLRGYAAAFHPRLIALTGREHEIRRIATTYKVYYEKVRIESANLYLIDHAAFTFLLDRNGKYLMFFPPGTPAQRMTTMVSEQLHRGSGLPNCILNSRAIAHSGPPRRAAAGHCALRCLPTSSRLQRAATPEFARPGSKPSGLI